MIATRTLSTDRSALPLVEAICFLSLKLLSDGQDSLYHRERGGDGEEIHEPLQWDAQRRQDQPRRDDDDALGAAADADVAIEADQLRFRAGAWEEVRGRHCGE